LNCSYRNCAEHCLRCHMGELDCQWDWWSQEYHQDLSWRLVSFFNVPETLMHIFGYGRKGREFDILKNFRGVAKPGEMVLVPAGPVAGALRSSRSLPTNGRGYLRRNSSSTCTELYLQGSDTQSGWGGHVRPVRLENIWAKV
jgi:hypothetical protein